MNQSYFPIGDQFRRVMTQYHYCDHCTKRDLCATGMACKEYKRWALQESASLEEFNPIRNSIGFNPEPTEKNFNIIFNSGDDNSQIE